ncbi:hypothetical protein [Roseivivax marinus]|uniref:hypothetical protein n=1 Tax=Roseivivax marinus TaxID=1379903 RepID=UPI000B87326C|nr:hypothetical protein [Roseivivax marinus]
MAEERGAPIAATVFPRLTLGAAPRIGYMLSPFAVTPERQRQSIAQALLSRPLADLVAGGAEVTTSYPDPAF